MSNDPVLGRIYNGNNLQIYFFTWAQLIQSAKGRMEFLRKHLNLEVTIDNTSEYFKKKYPHIFKEVETSKKNIKKKKTSK